MGTIVKAIGKSGQISLGKEFAGRNVLIEEIDTGVWLIKRGEFIPDNERWLRNPGVESDLEEAIEWAEKHKPGLTDLDSLAERLSS